MGEREEGDISMMDEQKYLRIWQELTDDLMLTSDLTKRRPLLAHYTSMQVVESLLAEGQIWMSNPLNMNDVQEVGYGIHLALNEILISALMKTALKDDELHRSFLAALYENYNDYGTREVKDLFVACFSEHEAKDFPDGKLSMWRGYGDFGNGAAIVIDTGNIADEPDTPFIFSEVWYASEPERQSKIRSLIARLAEFVAREGINAEEISGLAHVVFRRVVLAAIFTKHKGFEEEREWRIAYFPDLDKEGTFKEMISYHHGPKGLEPKLKLQLEKDKNKNGIGLNLNELIWAIVIGPRIASPLSNHAAETMLRKIGREALTQKLKTSTIPFRR